MPNRKKLHFLSHQEDVHCIIFHILVLSSYLAAFWIYLHPAQAGLDSGGEIFAFIAASALMLGWISGIDVGVNYHNHVHREIFRSPTMNLWFARFWPVVGGWPAFCWKHSHTTVHHNNILGPEDWTLPRQNKNGEIESLFIYSIALWPWRSIPCLRQDARNQRFENLSTQEISKETFFFLIIWTAPFFVDPPMALCLWVLPQLIANTAVMGPGMYAQHYGCTEPDKRQKFTHSNTFLSQFFNLTMFNIGYHIEHHQWPLAHWSILPRIHARNKQRIIEGGGHIVPFGYYRGGQLLSAWFLPERGHRIFLTKQPDIYQAASHARNVPTTQTAEGKEHII